MMIVEFVYLCSISLATVQNDFSLSSSTLHLLPTKDHDLRRDTGSREATFDEIKNTLSIAALQLVRSGTH